MSGERISGPGEEVDLATIAMDDQLLDLLGRGEPTPEGDNLATMFAAWRDDLDEPADDAPAPPIPAAKVRKIRGVRFGPGMLRLAAAVVASVVIATGLGVVSRDAGPTSPLWALTKVLHPEQAELRLVEEAIRGARDAAAAGRMDEAWELTEQAQRRLHTVQDPDSVRRLTDALDALRRDLLAAAPVLDPPAGTPVPPLSVTPTPPSVTPSGPSGAGLVEPHPVPPGPTPAASPTPGPLLDAPLPDLPLPSLSPGIPSLPGLPLTADDPLPLGG